MTSSQPHAGSDRITNLDTVRGVATLGILVMNAISFGLIDAAYFNLDAAGSRSWLDWIIGGLGEVFIDQKTMALFSLLFGVGMVVFIERAEAKGVAALRLSLWRNLLLLGIGLAHALVWDGDVLTVYAICAPIVLLLRRRNPVTLLGLGTAALLSSAVAAVMTQTAVPATGEGLGSFWYADGGAIGDAVGLFLISDFFLRALGMMLIGVALYRLDVVQGTRPPAFYRSMVRWGLAIGLPLTMAGLAWQVAEGFSPNVSVAGLAPNTLATIPMALAYVGLISLWNQRTTTALHVRVRAVGRMALTNYLAQTVLGIVALRVVLERGDLTRSGIAAFVLGAWVLQLLWSKPWLERFRFGPIEWLWRSATYRTWQPLRR
ncbi:MAG: DUF418 domain-containing protein [Actinomycetia bacterium]|nr:DUF418 domain-containing protein [Actinomycetes bacterium]